MPTMQRSGRAMGTVARVTVVGDDASVLDAAFRRIADLESKWSRFLPTSELSRVNASNGAPCMVSPDTVALAQHLVAAWRSTGGRFDPTVHDALVSLGYSSPFPFVDEPLDARSLRGSTPGCDGVHIDPRVGLVWLPDGVRLDPGGLGKGLAADLVARELVEAGSSAVLVDIGGDLRAIGEAPGGGPWRIGVEHPELHEDTIAVVETFDGGIATTSRRKRRWRSGGVDTHHVLDPATSHSADRPWASVTALAPTAVAAEVAATVTFLDGNLDGAPHALAALLADEQGGVEVIGPCPSLIAVCPMSPATRLGRTVTRG